MEKKTLMIYDNPYLVIHELEDRAYIAATFLIRERAEKFVEGLIYGNYYVVDKRDGLDRFYKVINA